MLRRDAELFRNPYVRWARWAAGLGLLSVALAVPLRGFAQILVPTIGATLGFIFWLAFWLTSRTLDKTLKRFREGEWLGRWEVEGDRWLAWAEDRHRKRKRAGMIVGLIFGAAVLVAAGLCWAEGDERAAAVLVGVAVVVAVVCNLAFGVRIGPTGGRGPFPVVVGKNAAVTPGAVFFWRGLGVDCLDAEVRGDALCVRYVVSTQHGRHEHTVEIPVPALAARSPASWRPRAWPETSTDTARSSRRWCEGRRS